MHGAPVHSLLARGRCAHPDSSTRHNAGVATAPSPRGPYKRLHPAPLLAWHGAALGYRALRAEDPYLWRCGDSYLLLAKLMSAIPQLGLARAQIVYTRNATGKPPPPSSFVEWWPTLSFLSFW